MTATRTSPGSSFATGLPYDPTSNVSQHILDRAIALDDDAPVDVCPGCGVRFGSHTPELHYPPNGRGWASPHCPWTGIYLKARRFRKAIIANHPDGVSRRHLEDVP